MDKTNEQLCFQLEQQGYKGRAVPIQHLQDLQQRIHSQHTHGFFDEEFFQERLTFFEFTPPDNFPNATSLIVVAMPRPQTRVNFIWNEQTLRLILPPTYVGYSDIPGQIENHLARILTPLGYRVIPARLPLKALAVRSGLAEYGRNNITYIQGLGSFFQLAAFYSDLPCEEDTWREPHMMDICQKCDVCLRKCPTHAILPDRFLIQAEKCLVFHNERGPEYPFPAWIESSAHNCLIGCMSCQKYCPTNKSVLKWVESDVTFVQHETKMLLEGVPLERLPDSTVEKLKHLDLMDSLDILPRNLRVYL